MGSEQQARICELMRLQQHQSAGSYLGLPLVVPKSKKLAFSEIKAKVESKIFGWKAHALSQAGHTILIQSVAAALPT